MALLTTPAKANSCLDFEVVWDEVTAAIVVQYCQGTTEAACTNQQLRSVDRGKTWIKTSIVKALGPDDGVLVRLIGPSHNVLLCLLPPALSAFGVRGGRRFSQLPYPCLTPAGPRLHFTTLRTNQPTNQPSSASTMIPAPP